ncbi:MAG: tetratricopeptide repeat protein [Bdellovibrionales bacterium]
MTNENLFKEIQEDIERQKLEALWKRYGKLTIACCVALVLGTASASAYREWKTQQNQKVTAELASIMNENIMDATRIADPAKRVMAFDNFAQASKGHAQATLAALHAAAVYAREGQAEEAQKRYEEISEDTKADDILRKYAAFMSIMMQMDSGDATALDKKLEPLAADDFPWRYSAREGQGYLALKSGDKAKAAKIFSALTQDAAAPRSLAARAADMLRLAGG